MTLIEALFFGLVQGLTEFLPVSSSAHVKFAKLLCHVESSESQVLFDLICHLGTLLALLYFLKEDLMQLLRCNRKQLLFFFLALLPLVPAYFFLKPLREWASDAHYLGFCLILTSFFLFAAHKWKTQKTFTFSQQATSSLWIGLSQSAALIPGISRSASTICCATLLGWEVKQAVRFSFLLSIPTIIGGNSVELLKLYLSKEPLPSLSCSACTAGFLASFFCGLFVIRFALSFLEKGNFRPFAWYCLGLGLFISIYLNLW